MQVYQIGTSCKGDPVSPDHATRIPIEMEDELQKTLTKITSIQIVLLKEQKQVTSDIQFEIKRLSFQADNDIKHDTQPTCIFSIWNGIQTTLLPSILLYPYRNIINLPSELDALYVKSEALNKNMEEANGLKSLLIKCAAFEDKLDEYWRDQREGSREILSKALVAIIHQANSTLGRLFRHEHHWTYYNSAPFDKFEQYFVNEIKFPLIVCINSKLEVVEKKLN